MLPTLLPQAVLAAVAALLLVTGCSATTTVEAQDYQAGSSTGEPARGQVEAGAAGESVEQNVLSAAVDLPAGMMADELLADPAQFLDADNVSADQLRPDAVRSPDALRELEGMALLRDVLAGEQLVTSAFGEFQGVQQVIVVKIEIPRGTSVNELVSTPTVYFEARESPINLSAPGAINSIGELQELQGMVLDRDLLPGEQLARDSFEFPSDFESLVEERPGYKLDLLPSQAVDGRLGSSVAVVITTGIGSGKVASFVAFDEVPVLDADDVFLSDFETADGRYVESKMRVVLDLTAEQARVLDDLDESSTIRLAVPPAITGRYIIAVGTTEQYLDGIAEPDEVERVSIFDIRSGDVVADDVLPLGAIWFIQAPTDSYYRVLIEVEEDDLLSISSVLAAIDVVGFQPA